MQTSTVQQPLPQLPKNVPPAPVMGQDPGNKPGVKPTNVPSWIAAAQPSKANAGQKQLTGQ